LSSVYGNIGVIYGNQDQYEKALENYSAALAIKLEIGDKQGAAKSYDNIGTIYQSQGKFQKALESEKESMKISLAIDDKQGVAQAYNDMGDAYAGLGKYDLALTNDLASLKIQEEVGDKKGIAYIHISIAYLYLKKNKVVEAKKEGLLAFNGAQAINSKIVLKKASELLTRVDSVAGDWKGAYQYHYLFKVYNDSIFTTESFQKTAEMNALYESEKKETQIRLLEKDNEHQAAITLVENKRHRTILISVITGLSLMILFSVFLYNRWTITRRQNTIIQKQKRLVDEQKALVDEKNKDITDSINYARRIQQAKLPERQTVLAALPQSFILFKPKDIVSGDFYFFHKNKGHIILAAADCTGHGVPGAFMSLIGSDKLEEAVLQTSNTSEILSRLNAGIKKALRQSDKDQSTRDGMDIALCSINNASGMISFAGANRPIWIIRKDKTELEEIKGTKYAIGGFTDDSQAFDSHPIQLAAGDTFYLFTDGYADTFGGPKGKKVTTRLLKDTLLAIRHLSMPEQEKHLDKFIEQWKGNTEQVDDILVIGIRV
ncbi:MAG TPA: SpoIIE family protein phosphatase, partial [Bacteroidia bacterium]|nr:SpoIIE family protein phosphatase [Bacteroidia bacterium]